MSLEATEPFDDTEEELAKDGSGQSVTQILLLTKRVGDELTKAIYMTSTEGWSIRFNVQGLRRLISALDKADRTPMSQCKEGQPIILWSSNDDGQ